MQESFYASDRLKFYYYENEYSMFVMQVDSSLKSAIISIKGVGSQEIKEGQTFSFNIDGEEGFDFDVHLKGVADNIALFGFKLIEKEEPEPELEPAVNTAPISAPPANNTPPASSSSNSSRNSSSKPKPLPNGEKEAAEKVVYDINININIPPGGGFGTLIIVLIVGCGLFAYKKIRKRIRDKDERINAGLPEPAKEPSRLILFLKWLGRNLKKARKWIGSKIAGEDFSKKKKKKRRH